MADYRALFPGYEDLVEEQFALISSAEEEPSASQQDERERAEINKAQDAPMPAATCTGVGLQLGPYRMQRELGRGGQGEVWLAEDQRIGRKVALKTLTALGHLSAQGVARLQREARVAARLDDPGICTVYEADQVAGVPFVAMQWIDGPSLREVIGAARAGESRGALPLPAKTLGDVLAMVAFFEAAALALQHAHDKGVLRRDIKPGNILVDGDGRAILLDFGLAHDLAGQEESLSEGISGTPAYLEPSDSASLRLLAHSSETSQSLARATPLQLT